MESEATAVQTKQWDVGINIAESGEETHVRAVLTTVNGTVIEGSGHARRHPRDRSVPEIGDEPAAGRALIDLGSRPVRLAAAGIAEPAAG